MRCPTKIICAYSYSISDSFLLKLSSNGLVSCLSPPAWSVMALPIVVLVSIHVEIHI